jgi:DNA polymerase III epsilon subunit-like protein
MKKFIIWKCNQAMKLAVIDIETTGLHPLSNRITEIGIVLIENGIITDRYEKLFNP